MQGLKTRGIVLKRRAYGEADRILTILTPRAGKIVAIAKGVRRPKSRFVGHVELFSLVDWTLAEGRTWHIVTDAQLVRSGTELGRDLRQLNEAGMLMRLVDRLVPAEESVPNVFALVSDVLGGLSREHTSLLLRQFEWQLLLALGHQPELRVCSHCRQSLSPDLLGLCPRRGGALCPECLRAETIHVPIQRDTLKVLRLFERAPLAMASRLPVHSVIERELERVNQAFLEHTLEAALDPAVQVPSTVSSTSYAHR